jgi:hypothetical protein
MRKITKKSVEAFLSGYDFKSDNTQVVGKAGATYLKLHHNTIACKLNDGTIEVSLAGWNTKVTRERLNGIPGVSISTRKGQAFLNGNLIEDDKFYVI